MKINGYEYISEQDFDRDWKPRVKPDGELFTHEEACNFPIRSIWTVYEDDSIDDDGYSDNNWYVMPGIVPACALGYLVTDLLWNEDTQDAIWYLDTDEYAREERRSLLKEVCE